MRRDGSGERDQRVAGYHDQGVENHGQLATLNSSGGPSAHAGPFRDVREAGSDRVPALAVQVPEDRNHAPAG